MNKVTWGPASIIGFGLSGISTVIVPGLAELSDATEPLGVDPQVWVVGGLVLGAVTIIGRMAQAMILLWRRGPEA